MTLSEIAADVQVTAEQRDRGVATVDDTATDIADGLAEYAADLPCTAEEAATVVEAYADGASVGAAGGAAGVAPMTAAKALHRLGVRGLSPLSPRQREIVRDWLAADLPRSEALALCGETETEFALAAYVETHDPVPGAAAVAERALADAGPSEDPLDDAMSSVDELL